MIISKIPAYFYPTSVVLIDDNKRFLNNVCLDLDESIAYKLFDDSEIAYQFFLKKYKIEYLSNRCLNIRNEDNMHNSNYHVTSLNISSIFLEVYNKNRFSEISVLVLDYDMPKIDGLEFARKIREMGFQIKIIMITAVVDERTAVKAFNDRVIDSFLLKNDQNFISQLNESIKELQFKYFQDTSGSIIKHLSKGTNDIINKTSFIKIFNDLYQSNRFSELYLYDSSGSYIMFDSKGIPSWLAIKNSLELDDYYDLAKDSKASHTILNYLKEGKMIPFFTNPAQLDKVNGGIWEKNLFNAKRLNDCTPTVFYSLISIDLLEFPPLAEIVSFDEYMNKHWPSF